MSASMLIVGAFPPAEWEQRKKVFGGVLRSCRLLMQSSLPQRVRLTLVDSTQVSIPPPTLLVRALLAVVRSFKYLARFELNRPEVVLIFSASGASFVEKSLYAAYARARGSRVMFFLRDGAFMGMVRSSVRHRGIARAGLRSCDAVLCQSSAWRDFYISEVGLSEAQCQIVENWTVGEGELSIGRSRSYRVDNTITLLFLGWIEATKGVFDLLEAFRRLIGEHDVPSIRLVLAGGGSDLQRCKEWVIKNGIEKYVSFAGWVVGDDKKKLLSSSDIFVLPSYFEGVSNAMLEAMAAGLPVVVTRVGGLPDVVEDERQGLLIDPGDIDALSAALYRLLSDPTLRERLGQEAHRVASRYDVETAVERLLQIADRLRKQLSHGDG